MMILKVVVRTPFLTGRYHLMDLSCAGFGMTGVIQEPGNKQIHLEPITSTSPTETDGAAVATTTTYKDFSLTLDVITKRQLRQNSPPNNWETAWLNWNAIDQFHAYGFTLKVLGFQLEKKDNNNQDHQ